MKRASALWYANWRKRRAIRTTILRASAYAFTTGLAVLYTIPTLWMVISSLKNPKELTRLPPTLVPEVIVWRNYIDAFVFLPFNLFIKHSAIYVTHSIIGTCISCTLVAYGFARLRFRGRDALFGLVLATMMLPPQVILIPKYILFRNLGWIDTLKPLVVPTYFGDAFYIFLLRQFFLSVPLEMDEAALIDGANRFGIFWRIVLPLAKPIVVTIVAFEFIKRWNDFMGPLIYLNSLQKMTVSVGLKQYQAVEDPHYELMMAASVMSLVPIVAVFFAAQRYFVASVTMTGIKG